MSETIITTLGNMKFHAERTNCDMNGNSLELNFDGDGKVSGIGGKSIVAGVGEAPIDNQAYARKNGNWEVVSGGGGASIADVIYGTSTYEEVVAALENNDFVRVQLGGEHSLVVAHYSTDYSVRMLVDGKNRQLLFTVSTDDSWDYEISDFVKEAPADHKQYARKDGDWEEIIRGSVGYITFMQSTYAEVLNAIDTYKCVVIKMSSYGNVTVTETTKGNNFVLLQCLGGWMKVKSDNTWEAANEDYVIEAPNDGKIYARKNLDWEEIESVTVDSALSTTSVNAVQNKVITAALDEKVDSEQGKGLSSNDYTTLEKQKLSGIEDGAQVNTPVDSSLSTASENPVQNKVVATALNSKIDDAPNDSKTYGRNNGAWVEVEGGSGTSEVFVATIGVTSDSDIRSAYEDGKLIFVTDSESSVFLFCNYYPDDDRVALSGVAPYGDSAILIAFYVSGTTWTPVGDTQLVGDAPNDDYPYFRVNGRWEKDLGELNWHDSYDYQEEESASCHSFLIDEPGTYYSHQNILVTPSSDGVLTLKIDRSEMGVSFVVFDFVAKVGTKRIDTVTNISYDETRGVWVVSDNYDSEIVCEKVGFELYTPGYVYRVIIQDEFAQIFEIEHYDEFVEIGGRKYPVVTVGSTKWIAENLDLTWDGLSVGETGTISETTPSAWYYRNNEEAYGKNGRKCGLLYNINALNYLIANKSTLLPSEWDVVSRSDFTSAINSDAAGGSVYALVKDTDWDSAESVGTNKTRISIVQAGERGTSNSFSSIGVKTSMWTKDDSASSAGDKVFVQLDNGERHDYHSKDVRNGFSIRLVKRASSRSSNTIENPPEEDLP